MHRFLLAALTLTACSDPAPPTRTTNAEQTPETEAAETETGQPAEDEAEPHTPIPEPPLPEATVVRITMADGLELVGDLRQGASPSAPLVVLVHQLSTTRAEWEPLLRRLGAAPALTTFAIDMRGHGESVTRRGRQIAWADFETADWERVADDIIAALGHLRSERGLTPSRVVLVGSSIGSSAVILAGAREETVDAVVALSPGRAYRGVDTMGPMPGYRGHRAFLAVASRGEMESATTATAMATMAGSEALLVDGDRHGVGMFESAPESLDAVARFIREQAASGATGALPPLTERLQHEPTEPVAVERQ
ncbi:MAG TPA: alpha/beta fold hydrolase [Polyangiaceae bacterium]|nr:alpha/beta fold hydrolase [Polyangiaceae bacterium]